VAKGGGTILRQLTTTAALLAALTFAGAVSSARAATVAQMAADTDRAVAGTLGEAGEQALFGALAEVSVQVADRYDQWVRTGSDEHRRAALAAGNAILPLLEKLRAHHQGRLDRAQAEIIREDGNPEKLYTERWWQLDRGFTLAAAGQLSWLHYRMAMLSPEQKEKRKAWLEKASREFSEFVGASDEKMSLESMLGRGMVARELGLRAEAEADLVFVLQKAKGTSLYWPARMAVGELRASGGGPAAVTETQKLLAEAQSAGVPAATIQQIRLLRFDALLSSIAAGGGGEGLRAEAASLAAQLSSQGPALAQRVTQMATSRLKDPRPVLGATVSAEWIAAENLAAAEKFTDAVKAYERIAASTDPAARSHADEVHHRLGVCYFRLGRYADAEREFRAYLGAAPSGPLAAESAYLQFRSAEGVFRATPTGQTRSSFLAIAQNFVKAYPDHESAYEGHFRSAELLQDERRYTEAAEAYAQVQGPPQFRLRAAAGEVQSVADTLSTAEGLDAAASAALRARAEAAWDRFDRLATTGGASASDDLKARTTVARAIAAGSGPGSDASLALSLLDGFETRFPKVTDVTLPIAAIRVAAAVALAEIDRAEKSTAALAAMPGVEANYFDLVEKLSRALLRRSADVAPEDPDASRRWAAMATVLLDRLRAAGRPIPDEVKRNLAQSYVEQERLSDAAAIYTELLAATPESRSLLRAAALVADRRQAAEDSVLYWGKLAMMQEVATPAWYEARLALATALAKSGQGDKACRSLREVETFRPDLRDAELKKRFAAQAATACAAAP
jgi:tetratricopeptide (TPR) repeat protein